MRVARSGDFAPSTVKEQSRILLEENIYPHEKGNVVLVKIMAHLSENEGDLVLLRHKTIIIIGVLMRVPHEPVDCERAIVDYAS